MEVSEQETEEMGELSSNRLSQQKHTAALQCQGLTAGSLAWHTRLSQQRVPEASWSSRTELSPGEIMGFSLEHLGWNPRIGSWLLTTEPPGLRPHLTQV